MAKATLYNNRELRGRIETLRQQQAQAPIPKQIKREINDSNKDAILESLKRRIKKLEDENKQLREQLKVAYADVYKKI
ncbi:putative transposition regulatory protein TnpC [Bacillus pseudomycoides]|nr:putative transposition regulatory protein TnpC [Bacillus pseudomycoides]AJI15052.1 putative transposition regulatory protein TnpC [Bacillus pseudomycoides]